MLRGRFEGGTGRPYIVGSINILRLGVEEDVAFLVDTGADVSVLMPLDVFRIGIMRERLSDSVESIGLGGISVNFVEDATIAFSDSDDGILYVYELSIEIAPAMAEIADVPSLLGRDVLNRWSMIYNPNEDRLEFEAVSADSTIRVR